MKRGEIYSVDLEPVIGLEQRGLRPCFVVSGRQFNAKGLAWVCPISSGAQFARQAGFGVSLINPGMTIGGIILCHQLRSVSIHGCFRKKIEVAPDYIVDEVLAKLQAILEDED
jgi:mRNA interferase ChpB